MAQAQPAQKKARAAKSVRQCMRFSQTMGTDLASVDLSLTSRCKFEVVCSLEWEVSCLPATATAAVTADEGDAGDAVEKRSNRLQLSERWDVSASAGVCEADWEIQDVRWSCVASES